MEADHLTRLVQQVDLLLQALRTAREECKKWKIRATELERLKLQNNQISAIKDKIKIIDIIEKIISELDQAQNKVLEKDLDE